MPCRLPWGHLEAKARDGGLWGCIIVLDDSVDRGDMRGKLPPFDLRLPEPVTCPLVFASPHSGRDYPQDFVRRSRLDATTLRRSEDAFVDELFAAAPDCGAPILRALFPRAYVDVNREAYELDPAMFKDRLPAFVKTHSPRIAAGLGTIPKVVANGEDIYPERLSFAEAKAMIEACYEPYHRALKGLIDQARERFGYCLLIDCHSMPSFGNPPSEDLGDASHHISDRRGPNSAEQDSAEQGNAEEETVDFVLGDGHGSTCKAALVEMVDRHLTARGFQVARNAPYAGGFCTRFYGRPDDQVHALQIEINRKLYMDERRIVPAEGFSTLKAELTDLIRLLGSEAPALLAP